MERESLVNLHKNFLKTRIIFSVLAPNDFDNDGDIDVFIGSRSVPGVYGINPNHQLLVNDGRGVFSNQIERYGYELRNIGMVTDAVWADINGNDKNELITVSDWGSPFIFEVKGGFLKKMQSPLDSLSGWWLSLASSDLDNDGDIDFILGNKGINLPYLPSEENPTKLWINDFDENGIIEKITTIHENGGDYPIHMRKEITMQINFLKKDNLKASDYSEKTIEELFDSELLKRTIIKEVKIPYSVVVENLGNGDFNIKKLPPRIQFSCVCGISCKDINGDGNQDIILGGNNFEYRPQYSRQDASFGDILLGDGALNFKWQNYSTSGFYIKGEVKHLVLFKDSQNDDFLFVSINDTLPKVYKFNEDL